MWQPQTADRYRALKRLGITAATVPSLRNDGAGETVDAAAIRPLLETGLRWYVENIATDFYAPYHKWSPDHPVNWRFLEAQRLYRENPRDGRALVREPSLSDPQWLDRIRDRLKGTVGEQARYKPLYYSLGDETGIADLAAYWDFDFSDQSLGAMRDWLKGRYGTLDALNRQWGANFRDWRAVAPMITPDAMQRQDENYSAWADGKEWMDIAFAAALKHGADAVHAADPTARAGIEGAQIPGWGGYDYARLSGAVDVMEVYDHGANVEIARSLNPELVLLTTSFEGGARENHRIWRELLQGSRGLILWDENHEFVRADGSLGPRGMDAASTFREIRDGIGARLIAAKRHYDPIAILYSPASFRIGWMLDWRNKGDAWSRRDAAAEYDPTPLRTSTVGYLDALEHAGFQPRFVSSAQIEQGGLTRGGYRMLVLPQAIALSASEAQEIRRFAEAGGIVVADLEPGAFDAHGRKLAQPLLAGMFDPPSRTDEGRRCYGKGEAIYAGPDPESLRSIAKQAGLEPVAAISGPGSQPVEDVRRYVFDEAGGRILAVHRDLDPKAAGSGGPIVLTLPRPAYVYDLRRKAPLGKTDHVTLDLGTVEPVILGLYDNPQPP